MNIWKFILGKSLSNVTFVKRNSLIETIWRDTFKFTLEKNLSIVTYVKRSSLWKVIWIGILKFTVEKDLSNVTFCEKKGNLNLHFKIHTGERSFQCECCEKNFTQKHHLTKHFTAIHTRILDDNWAESIIFHWYEPCFKFSFKKSFM